MSEFKIKIDDIEYSYFEKEDSITITKCEASSEIEVFNIPDTINCKLVTEIGEGAFKKLPNDILTIKLPKNLKKIGKEAFVGIKTKSITFPDSLEVIGIDAFRKSSRLTKITFGKNSHLKEVWDSAFYSCKHIKKLVLPDSIECIKSFAFGAWGENSEIYIGKNIDIIEPGAFNSEPKSLDDGFEGCCCDIKIHIAMDLLDKPFICLNYPDDSLIAISDDAEKSAGEITYKPIGIDTAAVTKFKEGIKEIIIPQTVTIDGKVYKVTKINRGCFKKSKKNDDDMAIVTKCVLPETITDIADDFFEADCLECPIILPKDLKKPTRIDYYRNLLWVPENLYTNDSNYYYGNVVTNAKVNNYSASGNILGIESKDIYQNEDGTFIKRGDDLLGFKLNCKVEGKNTYIPKTTIIDGKEHIINVLIKHAVYVETETLIIPNTIRVICENAVTGFNKLIFEENSKLERIEKYSLSRSSTDEEYIVKLPSSVKYLGRTNSYDHFYYDISDCKNLTYFDILAIKPDDNFLIPASVEVLNIDDCENTKNLKFENDSHIKYIENENNRFIGGTIDHGAIYLGSEKQPHLVLVKCINPELLRFETFPDTRLIMNNAFKYNNFINLIVLNEGLITIDNLISNLAKLKVKIVWPSTLEYVILYDRNYLEKIYQNLNEVSSKVIDRRELKVLVRDKILGIEE